MEEELKRREEEVEQLKKEQVVLEQKVQELTGTSSAVNRWGSHTAHTLTVLFSKQLVLCSTPHRSGPVSKLRLCVFVSGE